MGTKIKPVRTCASGNAAVAEQKIHKLASAIARYEGYYISEREAKMRKMRYPTIAQRCNNPGNLIYVGQQFAKPYEVRGSDGKLRVYAHFDTPEHGWNALVGQIVRDAARNLTLEEFIHKYAPASDGNNPASYLATVARSIGAKPSDLLVIAIAEEPTKSEEPLKA